MAWSKVEVNAFSGLNSTVAPELIKDGEARDILNMRMEHVGKLVSRDGVYLGMEIGVWNDSMPVTVEEYTGDPRTQAYMQCHGILGIGEYILSSKWDTIDTDRLMVYVVRGEMVNQSEHDGFNHKEVILMSPMDGKYRNQLIVSQFDTVSDQVDTKPQGVNDSTRQLYAPNRAIPGLLQGAIEESHWINHYVDLHQYRNKFIISDRTNGDMLLEDYYDQEINTQAVNPQHNLHLRPNCLDSFDIDIVKLEDRISDGLENDETVGVENGMALYGYDFPKVQMRTTEDHFADTLSNEDWSGGGTDNGDIAYSRVEPYRLSKACTTMLSIYNYYNFTADVYWQHRDDKTYFFTNAGESIEMPDVSQVPILPNKQYVDEDGVKRVEKSSDVYVWDDYPIKYYPCHGIDNTTTHKYLRQLDRTFTKLSSQGVKLFELNEKKAPGDKAPLGVWRYRFVWDFGNGVYSAPSTEMLCPDIMWSAVPDAESDNSGVLDSLGNYTRPAYNNEDDFLKHRTVNRDQELYRNNPYGNPAIFDGNDHLTIFGEKYFNLKHKLYHGLNHKYGVQNASIYTELNDDAVWDIIMRGEFATDCTIFFGGDQVKLNGWAWEGIAIAHNGYIWTNDEWRDDIGTSNENIVRNKGQIVVPIFQTAGKPPTYNSLCDDHGRIRLAYQADSNTPGPNTPSVALIAPGWNFNLAFTNDYNNDIVLLDYRRSDYASTDLIFAAAQSKGAIESDLYFNIIPYYDEVTGAFDRNNEELGERGGSPLNELRTNTIARGVSDARDQLTYIRQDVDTEAANRLVISGIYPIQLCEPEDEVSVISEYIKKEKTNDDLAIDYDGVIVRQGVWTDNSGSYANTYIENLEIILYGQAQRFMGVEQLTAYFPSSLVFDAPRVGIRIDNADIPAKAKRLLIFRTRSSHSNDWQPNQYGLVDAVDIGRVQEGDDEGKALSDVPGEGDYLGFYYFDKVKDAALDFSYNVLDYEGLRKPIKSRFNMPLNERVYYFNFIEEYQPLTPRKFEYNEELEHLTQITNISAEVYPSEGDSGFAAGETVYYKIVYKDATGIVSQVAASAGIEIAETLGTVVLYFLPSGYDDTIDAFDIYRSLDGVDYKYIGVVEHEDEGIFVDDNTAIATKLLGSTDPVVAERNSGVRWSEPYAPDWIKADSYDQYNAGDGKHITGVMSVMGSIIVFKETSMYRQYIQGQDIPFTRRDEISPILGLVAPHAKYLHNNYAYFLTHQGVYIYDNNFPKKIDTQIEEELRFVLFENEPNEIRDASMGYNPRYDMLYLNVPMLRTGYDDGRQLEYGRDRYYDYDYVKYGHIYVLDANTGYWTKFGYCPTITDGVVGNANANTYVREITDPAQLIRIYYTNSFGELRSGDILPGMYGSFATPTVTNNDGHLWSGLYLETPDAFLEDEYKDTDTILSGRYLNQNYSHPDLSDNMVLGWDFMVNAFPPTIESGYKVAYFSKFFTGDAETVIKRIRKVLVNLYSKSYITVRVITIPYETHDERIDNIALPLANQTFTFDPSVPALQPLTGIIPAFTNRQVLSVVPQWPYTGYTSDDNGFMQTEDDQYGKPVRVSIVIEAKLRTQLNSIVLHIRPIHTYLS